MNALRKATRARALVLGLTLCLSACEEAATEPGGGPGDQPPARSGQTISFPQNTPSSQPYNSLFPVAPTASSGLAVSLALAGGCTADGGQIRMTSGTTSCVITASQAGNDSYDAAASVTHTVAATRIAQAIGFPQNTPTSQAVNSRFSVAPTASSGLVVSVALSGGCVAEGGQIRMTSDATSCIITASQAGDENYTAAADVTHTVAATAENPPPPPPGGSSVPAVAVGKWTGGLMSFLSFWDDHSGAYQGPGLSLAILFDFEASGRYRQATYIISRSYGCMTQMWSLTEGIVTFTENTFQVRPDTGQFKLTNSCNPARDEERPLRPEELNGATYYWAAATDDNGRPVLLIAPSADSRPEVFRQTN